jgi:hypothetical protein
MRASQVMRSGLSRPPLLGRRRVRANPQRAAAYCLCALPRGESKSREARPKGSARSTVGGERRGRPGSAQVQRGAPSNSARARNARGATLSGSPTGAAPSACATRSARARPPSPTGCLPSARCLIRGAGHSGQDRTGRRTRERRRSQPMPHNVVQRHASAGASPGRRKPLLTPFPSEHGDAWDENSSRKNPWARPVFTRPRETDEGPCGRANTLCTRSRCARPFRRHRCRHKVRWLAWSSLRKACAQRRGDA